MILKTPWITKEFTVEYWLNRYENQIKQKYKDRVIVICPICYGKIYYEDIRKHNKEHLNYDEHVKRFFRLMYLRLKQKQRTKKNKKYERFYDSQHTKKVFHYD